MNTFNANTFQYAPLPGVEHSSEGINGCHSHNAKPLLTN